MGGAILITFGYASAIVGGGILFKNTPPDVGGEFALMIPRSSGRPDQQEGENIRSRQFWNRIGFALVTFGAILQLSGYWWDRLYSN